MPLRVQEVGLWLCAGTHSHVDMVLGFPVPAQWAEGNGSRFTPP